MFPNAVIHHRHFVVNLPACKPHLTSASIGVLAVIQQTVDESINSSTFQTDQFPLGSRLIRVKTVVKTVAPAKADCYFGTVNVKYRKLLAAETFAPTAATREARKAALVMNLSPAERHRLAAAGVRRAHAHRKPKALAVA